MTRKRLTDRQIPKYRAEPGERLEVWDTVEIGLHLRVSCDVRRGNKQRRSFHIRYRTVKGSQRRQKLGEYPGVDLKEARTRASKILAQVSDGRDPQNEKRQKRQQAISDSEHRVADLFEQLSQDQQRQGVKTWKETARVFKKDIAPILGSMSVSDVGAEHCQRVLDRIVRRGSLRSARRARSLMTQVFKFGLEHPDWRHLIQGNPVLGTRQPLKKAQPRDRLPTDDEFLRLWKAADTLPVVVGAAYRARLLLGQRWTEIAGMRWDELRDELIEPGTPREESIRVWDLPASRTKPDRAHLVPLPHQLQAILEEVRPIKGESEFVFESPRKKGSPIGRLNRSFRLWKKTAKVDDLLGVDLRRGVATGMARLGVSGEVVGAVLNHAPATITRQVYNKYDLLKEKSDALQRWADHLERRVTGKMPKVVRMPQR